MRRSHLVIVLVVMGLLMASCTQAPTAVPTMPVVRATAVPTEVPTATPEPPVATEVPPTATTAAPTATAKADTPAQAEPRATTAQAELTHTVAPPTAIAEPATATSVPPTAVPTQALPAEPDPAVGQSLWPQVSCSGCHGASAEGDYGPKLSGTGLSFDQVLARVRLGKGGMPAFEESQISDLSLRHIYAWLRSLARPTPSPIARPSFPTEALSEMWYYVNEMRIRADFAKDLPVRQAADDTGRLAIVKLYSGDGLNQAAVVLDRANQALNEVPNEGVREIIREIIRETNTISDLFRQAQSQSSYAPAWDNVAQAVLICRLDTQPWATQAIRDAGLTGTVRIRVVDQAGRAIPGAYATVLTAHTPLGARADGSGIVTFVNVAAVPALPVKAYVEGRVYHEINANISSGATIEGTIALPPLPRGGIAPAVANASIVPTSGPGNATVIFSVTATDPQGRLDLADDQIFALNPDLGLAYVMLHRGGNSFQVQERLPDLSPGLHTWYFFAVDHECNTSNIIPINFRVSQ